MFKHLVTFQNHAATILVEHNEAGQITSAQVEYGTMPPEIIVRLLEQFPTTLDGLKRLATRKNVKVDPVSISLDFDTFWNTYGHKVGKKARAESIWKVMPENARVQALAYLRTYNDFLIMNPGITRLYPETYLSQRRWEN